MNRAKRRIYFLMLFYKGRFLLERPKTIPFFLRDYLSRKFPKDRQNMIVSYPKSGRTWLEQLLLKAAAIRYGLPASESEHFQDLCRRNKDISPILLTHARSTWEDIWILDENEILEVDNERQAGERTLFLYRDPRDVQVSAYYHLKYRNGVRWITRQDMIDHPVVGLRKVIRFMNQWLAYSHTRGTLRAMSYERLHREPEAALKEVCELFGIEAYDRVLEQAVFTCSFSAMQRREEQQAKRSPRLGMVNAKQPGSRKARSGRVGDHRSFFSGEDLQRIDRIIEAELNPVFGYHTSHAGRR